MTEVILKGQYKFMYENFIVATQHEVYLLLQARGDTIDALKFSSIQFKYGYPNDEVGHPLSKYGLGSYGLFEVKNSPWLQEIINNNRSHSRHIDDIFSDYRHIIGRFKDVTFEILCDSMEEIEISQAQLFELVQQQTMFP